MGMSLSRQPLLFQLLCGTGYKPAPARIVIISYDILFVIYLFITFCLKKQTTFACEISHFLHNLPAGTVLEYSSISDISKAPSLRDFVLGYGINRRSRPTVNKAPSLRDLTLSS
jgi:hypothetical protein